MISSTWNYENDGYFQNLRLIYFGHMNWKPTISLAHYGEFTDNIYVKPHMTLIVCDFDD